ncbi:MAG: transglutaminase family protein [Rhodobacteraceae bacterium]|nr:transglutaminase family protein [Paracoccaceae bacterium]
MENSEYLLETALLDFHHPAMADLITRRGWQALPAGDRIGAAYDFVRNEIGFGYNARDTLKASEVLKDGYGQCNTKGVLLMALLRGMGIACRLHGFTIFKSLQRGLVPEAVYGIAPDNILHSWVEVGFKGKWVNLEGFILDEAVLSSLQAAFPERNALCAYGAGTDCLQAPKVAWSGADTYIQRTGVNADLGVFASPDEFFAAHQQDLSGLRGLMFRWVIRHWMNRRVVAIRRGAVPEIPGGETALNARSRPAAAPACGD